jgi:hypothetical protein
MPRPFSRQASAQFLTSGRRRYGPIEGSILRDRQSAGDHIPPGGEVIEIHLSESKQLFNAIDPAPFCEKDLDPKAEEFIVDWARELPANAPLTLVVLLDRPAGLPDEAQVLRDAVGQYFGMRSQASRQRLKRLFKIGRTSLLIGLLFLAVTFALGEIIESALEGQRIGELLRVSLAIGGWVAMWRPLEIFLYDWWPLRSERKLYDRLSAMPVRIRYADPEASLSRSPTL